MLNVNTKYNFHVSVTDTFYKICKIKNVKIWFPRIIVLFQMYIVGWTKNADGYIFRTGGFFFNINSGSQTNFFAWDVCISGHFCSLETRLE